eukprot:gene6459-10465_t
MLKQLFIVLLCLFALVHGDYVIQRLFDEKCEKPLAYGSFTQQNKCTGFNIGMYQKTTCNSTHVNVQFQCNTDCSSCGHKMSYPRDKCVPGFVGVKISCEEKLPKLKEKGIYFRQFLNPKCKNDVPGDFGTFITDEFCQSGPGQRNLFGVSLGKNIRSSRAFYDKDEKRYKLQTFDARECKGTMIQNHKFKLDICVKMPDPGYSELFYQKIVQPVPHAIFTKNQ